jgi:hypothetical protein
MIMRKGNEGWAEGRIGQKAERRVIELSGNR